MYDLVSKTFFTNSGSGTFTAGPDITSTRTSIYIDAPLRKIGNYTDYIDFGRQVVVRNSAEYDITGTETVTRPDPTSFPKLYLINTQGVPNDLNNGLCSHFAHCDSTWQEIEDGEFKLQNRNNPMFGFAAGTPVADIQSWFASLYSAGTPVRLFYPLATPTETPITLPSIPTLLNACYFIVDTTTNPSNSKILYQQI